MTGHLLRILELSMLPAPYGVNIPNSKLAGPQPPAVCLFASTCFLMELCQVGSPGCGKRSEFADGEWCVAKVMDSREFALSATATALRGSDKRKELKKSE